VPGRAGRCRARARHAGAISRPTRCSRSPPRASSAPAKRRYATGWRAPGGRPLSGRPTRAASGTDGAHNPAAARPRRLATRRLRPGADPSSWAPGRKDARHRHALAPLADRFISVAPPSPRATTPDTSEPSCGAVRTSNRRLAGRGARARGANRDDFGDLPRGLAVLIGDVLRYLAGSENLARWKRGLLA